MPLLLTLCALGTVWTWHYAPEFVDYLDDGLVKTYEGDSVQRLERAKATLSVDRNRAIRELHALVEDLSEYRKGDRLAGIAKQALLHLADAHAANKEFGPAAKVLERFTKIDERDLIVRGKMLTYMLKAPGRRKEAIEQLQHWHRRVPQSHFFVEPLAGALAADAKVTEGFEVHTRAHRRSIHNEWRITWEQAKHPFKSRWMAAPIIPRLHDKRLVMSVRLPPRATQFEIHLPRYLPMRLDGLKIQTLWPTGDLTPPISAEHLRGIQQTGDSFVTTSLAPRFVFRGLAAAKKALKLPPNVTFTIRLEADVTFLPTLAMARYARKHRIKLLANAAQTGDEAMAKLVNFAAAEAYRGIEVHLFWRDAKETFRGEAMLGSALTTRSFAPTRFTTDFSTHATIRFLRFDLPPRSPHRWRITGIRAKTATTTVLRDQPVAIKTQHVKRDGGVMTVAGTDPYVVFDLGGSHDISSVTIEGEIE